MTVIVDLTIPADRFELGHILRMEGQTEITVEKMVPLGDQPIPFIRVHNGMRDGFEPTIREHPSVNKIQLINSHEDKSLYALDWKSSDTSILSAIRDLDGVILDASGTADMWSFVVRFLTHEALSEFQTHYLEQNIGVSIKHVYNPARPDSAPWFKLTPAQRETLTYAVESGYYSIPREISTQELAEAFNISDQAVTERPRRGIATLVSNTVLVDPGDT